MAIARVDVGHDSRTIPHACGGFYAGGGNPADAAPPPVGVAAAPRVVCYLRAAETKRPSPRKKWKGASLRLDRETAMSFLKKILGGKSGAPRERVRVCSQCGMPVNEHKEWCSILNGQKAPTPAPTSDTD